MTHVNHAPSHSIMVRHMAEVIQSSRVRNVNDEFVQYVNYEPIGDKWVSRFMNRHPQLQTIIPRPIEAARVEDTSYEALKQYFDAIQSVSKEYNVQDENKYNMDESGFGIGTIEASKVIIDKQSSQNLTYHQASGLAVGRVNPISRSMSDRDFRYPVMFGP